MRSPAGLEGVSYRDVEVRLLGEVALLHGVFEAIVPGGKVSRVRYTDRYVWNGTAWRLVSAQTTPIKDDVPIAPRLGVTPAHAPWTGRDPTGDDLEVLRQLNESYVEASRRSDIAWYDAHLAPDYRVFSGDGRGVDPRPCSIPVAFRRTRRSPAIHERPASCARPARR